MTGGGRRRTPLFRPGPDAAAEGEIAHHIAERADRLVEEGWDPVEARREAERLFGDRDGYRREMTAAEGTTTRRWGMRQAWAGIAQDLRFGWRSALRRPGSTAVLVVTLGLGIGAGTAIFTVVDALLLRPLPYSQPDRLVSVYWARGGGITLPFMPAEQAETWRSAADFLQDVTASDRMTVARTDGAPETLSALVASHDLDDLLGVRPLAGRLLTPDDADPGARVALMTWKYWQRAGADPAVVGSTIELEGEPVTVVGILPRDFKWPLIGTSDIWVPLAADGMALGRPADRPELVGRLPEGVTREAAQERADALSAALEEQHPGTPGWRTVLQSVADQSRADPRTRRALNVLAGAVGLMLLVSLLNGANLLIVRTRGRVRELAVRRALGAGRGRVVRQIVVEALLPGLLSGLVALALAGAAVTAIGGMLPSDVALYSVYDPRLGPRVLSFAFVLAAGAGVVVGLIPALHLLRPRDGLALRGGPHGGGPAGTRLRSGLVVLELALSVVLLAGAGLLVNSFVRLVRVDTGFRAEDVAQVTLSLSESRYAGPPERRLFMDELERRVEALPGVRGASVSMGVPLDAGGISFASALQAEGSEPMAEERAIPYASVDGDFLEVLGIPLLAGRGLTEADRGRPVAMVDREMAGDLFGGAEAAVGRRFRLGEGSPWLSVAGVTVDLKMYGVSDTYGPYVMLRPRDADGDPPWMTVSARTSGSAAALLPALRGAVRELDPDQPIRKLQTGEEALGQAVAEERFLVVLMSVLSGAALALAAIGVYGVLAAVVAERRREMGIRMALGAGRASVRRLIVGRGMALAAAGVAVGLGGALAVTRLGTSLLYEVEPGDPLTLAVVAGVSLLAALGAATIPTVRATRVDPAEVLRSE